MKTPIAMVGRYHEASDDHARINGFTLIRDWVDIETFQLGGPLDFIIWFRDPTEYELTQSKCLLVNRRTCDIEAAVYRAVSLAVMKLDARSAL